MDIDLTGLTTLKQIKQAINAKVSDVAESDGGRLVLHSSTKGAASRLEVQEIPDNAAPRLFGLLPYSYRGSAATKAEVTGKPDVSGGVDLSEVRYLRLLIDGQHLAEVDCAAKATDPGHPTNVQLEQIKQAINEALGSDVASHDGKHLILTSPIEGFNSSIAFQPAAAQDAREQLFGLIETFHTGRDARPAETVGINDLSRGVDLSARARLRVKVDDRPPVTVSCAGNDPANTLLSEITAVLTAQLGPGTAFHDGRFLHLTSPTTGPASSIVFESLPPNEDATEVLFGITFRIFGGSDAAAARLVGTPDLSAGVDLAALHSIQIATDGGKPVEVNARGEALDSRKVKPSEIVKAINAALKQDIASHDGQHLILTSQTTGGTSQIDIKPLTVTHYRRFVTRAFTTDDAAQTVFGFFSREARGSAATKAQLIGKRDLSRGVDLRQARFLRLSIDSGAALDIDCAGIRPRATLVGEIVSKIKSVLGPSVADHDGRHLILTSPSTGGSSRIAFESTRASDAMDTLFGVQPAAFRGRDASRVTFVGVIDLSAGIDLPANAAVKLRIDGDEFEIPLAEAAAVHKTLNEIVIAINLKFGKTIAHHEGKHLILASPSTRSVSRVEFLVPGGSDSTQAVFGIAPPRAYHGQDARPAEVVGKALTGTVDLSSARFLRLAVNGGEPISIDCAMGISDPKQSTLAGIVEAIKAALTAAQISATAKAEGNRLILATTTPGATSRFDLLPYAEGDARKVLFGDIPDVTTGNDPTPAIITGEADLLGSVNLAEGRFLRLSVDGGRAVDVDIAGAAPATTFLDEIIDRINVVVPGLASATDNDRLRLTSPTTGQESRLEVLPLRALELIEFPPEPAKDPLSNQAPRAARHGGRWSVENSGAADVDLRIVLNAPHGVFGPGFVNHAQGLRIRLMIVLHPDEGVVLWREPAGSVRARIIKPDGTSSEVPDAQIVVEKLDKQKSCEGKGGGQDKAVALVLLQGRSEWTYLDYHGARFDRDRFNTAQFVGKACVERGLFNVSRFTCPPPSTDSTVYVSTGEPPDPPVEVRFHWLQHQPGAFTVNLPADLPERFGGRFNQARFAKAGDKPEEFRDVVTEPEDDERFIKKLINEGLTKNNEQLVKPSALVKAIIVPRVPIGFAAATIPFRKPRRLTGGSDTAFARLYLAEKDVTGFIELSARELGAWGNAIAVAARKSGPARFDVTISYQGARFENARLVVKGGEEELPALTEDLLRPGPVGILQAKAGGIKAQVTRDRAGCNG